MCLGLLLGLPQLRIDPLLLRHGARTAVLAPEPQALESQLVGGAAQDGLGEVVGTEGAHERQPCRGEQRLVPHMAGVGDPGDGDERGRGVRGGGRAEEGVARLVVREDRGQRGEVRGEVVGGAGDRLERDQRFGADGCEQTALRGGARQGAEGGLKLLRGWQIRSLEGRSILKRLVDFTCYTGLHVESMGVRMVGC
jgi:hypothetical protein